LKASFTEIQKYTQWWLWALLLVMAAIPIFGIFKQLIMGAPFGNNPMSDLGLIIFFLSYLAFMGFFWFLELRTEIDHRGIRVRLRPISTKIFKWEDIKQLEPVTYGFVGYGLRLSLKYGIVYNARGNKGLAIYLKNGRKYLIGTQRQDQVIEVITELGKGDRLKK
jgi:hypothetical protein